MHVLFYFPVTIFFDQNNIFNMRLRFTMYIVMLLVAICALFVDTHTLSTHRIRLPSGPGYGPFNPHQPWLISWPNQVIYTVMKCRKRNIASKLLFSRSIPPYGASPVQRGAASKKKYSAICGKCCMRRHNVNGEFGKIFPCNEHSDVRRGCIAEHSLSLCLSLRSSAFYGVPTLMR
ncbi:hypothetical protein ALC62_09487 [Cyphomyrmex costatus]|uniref:Uncharacterized protein n=1 Tax=Cyphomyrmex costatus TaxID=456900 RepID=A0A195CGM7_9HYME|nr:hypothetical protein ALC62_09487 [Cyphomyrmex costatus]